MSKVYRIISLGAVVTAIAIGCSRLSGDSIMQVAVLVFSGVLAHVLVTSAEKGEDVGEDGEGVLAAATRISGMTFRMAIGAVMLALLTMCALRIAGV